MTVTLAVTLFIALALAALAIIALAIVGFAIAAVVRVARDHAARYTPRRRKGDQSCQ